MRQSFESERPALSGRHGRTPPSFHGLLVIAAFALGVAIFSPVADAHHGWSGYHTTLETFTGQVVSYTYNNPHTALHLQLGSKTLEVVLAPPSRMERRGLRPDSFKPGDMVKVQGYAHRERDTEMRAERVEVNGQSYELR